MAEGKRKKFYSEQVRKQFKKKVVRMRVTEEDRNLIQEKADELGMTLTEYMHFKIFRKMDTDANPNKLIRDLMDYAKEVNKVGVNINQSTNYLNFLKNQQKVEPKALKDYGVLLRQFKALIEKQKSEILRECREIRKSM